MANSGFVSNGREPRIFGRLGRLRDAARQENMDGAYFADILDQLKTDLEKKVRVTPPGESLSANLRIGVEALKLFEEDPGDKWGKNAREPLKLSSSKYAPVPSDSWKCNAFVADVIHRATGIVHDAYAETQPEYTLGPGYGVGFMAQRTGRFFPYRAIDWVTKRDINGFAVVPKKQAPQIGDVWSNGVHVGIYLGTYRGKGVYVSARTSPPGEANVFGLQSGAQSGQGIQVKYLDGRGIFRRLRDEAVPPGLRIAPKERPLLTDATRMARSRPLSWEAPYRPGSMSRLYGSLNLSDRGLVNAAVDRRFAELTGVARKLTNRPEDLVLRRQWLRMRDEEMSKRLATIRSRPAVGGRF